METVHRLLDQDPFARHLGIELLELQPGIARARMPVAGFHRNPFGMVHGGALFTLADYVFQAACNSHGVLAVAVQASITYLQAPKGSVIYAEASEVSLTRRLGTYAIRVTEEEGRLVALFQGTCYRMPEKPNSS